MDLPWTLFQRLAAELVLSTGKASFSYADSILESWFKKGVHHLSDIDSLDQSFQQKRAAKAADSQTSANTDEKQIQ